MSIVGHFKQLNLVNSTKNMIQLLLVFLTTIPLQVFPTVTHCVNIHGISSMTLIVTVSLYGCWNYLFVESLPVSATQDSPLTICHCFWHHAINTQAHRHCSHLYHSVLLYSIAHVAHPIYTRLLHNFCIWSFPWLSAVFSALLLHS